MPRYVALRARNGNWAVAKIGKPYVVAETNLTEAQARARAKELTKC